MRFPQIHKKDMDILCVMLIIRGVTATAVVATEQTPPRIQRIQRIRRILPAERVLFAATGMVPINACVVMRVVTF